jgi:hypothetical protein
MTAAIAPCPARLAPLAIVFLVHRSMGAVKEKKRPIVISYQLSAREKRISE